MREWPVEFKREWPVEFRREWVGEGKSFLRYAQHSDFQETNSLVLGKFRDPEGLRCCRGPFGCASDE